MTCRVSVLVSTHNPDMGRLRRTLNGLFEQTLSAADWELVVVDNGSTPPLDAVTLGLARHAHARLVREEQLGLIFGRIAGIRNSIGELIVFCDDDTIFEGSYLQSAVQLFSKNPVLGVAIGKSLPEFEQRPPRWAMEFFGCLGLWDRGDQPLIQSDWNGRYPEFAGGGGGAVFCRSAITDFLNDFDRNGGSRITGRTGKSLTSGEDNHVILSLLKRGWSVCYVPELQ